MATLGKGRFTYEVSGENWGKKPEDWFYKEATSVAVDAKDQVYVFNRGNHPMIVYDRDGNVCRTWGEGQFKNPHAVTISPDGTVWCVDNSDSSIRQFTPEGKLLFTLNERGKASPVLSGKPFCHPTKVAIDPRNGEIVVSDGYGNTKVHRYTPDGKKLLMSFGESGTDPGQFIIVHDVDIDKDGYIYIGDRENRRVQVFDPKGKVEAVWYGFSRTAAVCVSKRGDDLVYVGEYFAGGGEAFGKAQRIGPRVSVLDKKGKVLARLGEEPFGEEPGRFWAPHMIASDSHGDIYVAEVSYAEWYRIVKPAKELRSMQKLVKKG